MESPLHRVVIIGGGFGGLYCAQRLKHAPVDLTLLDRRNFHLFQPLLYQVATGSLSPANIAAPLRAVLRKQKNTHVLLGEVTDIDAVNRKVILKWGEVPYDTLVVATGARHQYFGHDKEWESIAPGLKSIEDATDIRRRVLLAFEAAETEPDPVKRKAWLTFVVIGGGPTGVELAGSVGELALFTLKNNFRNFDPSEARILLVEGTDRILSTFPPKLSANAVQRLRHEGVTVRTGAMVTDVHAGGVTLKSGDKEEHVPARTILWAAGVQASPLGKSLERVGAKLDRAGRVFVEPDLSLAGHPEIFVIGDLASCAHQTGKPLPGVAPVAMQQGRYVARLIYSRLKGKALAPFHYRDKGNLATIGRNAAVADLGWIRLSGPIAWWAWLFIHILFLIHFENRLLVMLQWWWSYWSRGRAARLITGEDSLIQPGLAETKG
ncbi:MAG: NAD(P)/FAD-dependent oxidoreductase [Gemmataceae bacterium]|nr:NAD(P)/FAD-dependent oxidoreductase [Gemmataceae bacterium]